MKRLIVILTLVGCAGLTQIAYAQVPAQLPHNPIIVSPSVTSLAPGRSFTPGPSVTSLGPFGFSTLPRLGPARPFPHHGFNRGLGHQHGRNFGFGAFGTGAVVVPYAVPVYPAYPEGYPAYPETEMQPVSPDSGTPASYPPNAPYAGQYPQEPYPYRNQLQPGPQPPAPANYATAQPPAPAATPAPSANTQPPVDHARPQPTTVLVFNDGHKLEITNYAIQGSTLFNLGDKGPRKIALADLNLPATIAENDDKGVPFQLP